MTLQEHARTGAHARKGLHMDYLEKLNLKMFIENECFRKQEYLRISREIVERLGLAGDQTDDALKRLYYAQASYDATAETCAKILEVLRIS